MANRPTHIVKYEIKNAEGKTERSIRIGAAWAADGKRPQHIVLDSIPVGFTGRLTVWPAETEDAQ